MPCAIGSRRSRSRAPVNAIDHGLIEDLNAAYRQAKADPGVQTVILTSAFARAFSAGMDLAMIRGRRGLDLRRCLQKLYFEMHDLQYRGHALRAPAAPDRLPQGIRALVLRQSRSPRSRPSAWGWSTRSCRWRGSWRRRGALATDFAAKSPLVVELARDAFMRANDFEYRRAIENTVETICNIIETDDVQEGLAAFNEKRALVGDPRWRSGAGDRACAIGFGVLHIM